MKKISLLVTTLLFGFLISAGASAQKIAVVSVQAAILQSPFGQAELKKLEDDSTFNELVTQAKSLAADIQSLDTEAEANGSKWDAERVASYQKERQFLVADFQLNEKKIQAEREQVVARINAAMQQRARQALQELVEEEAIELLLNDTAVIVASDAYNITGKLASKIGN